MPGGIKGNESSASDRAKLLIADIDSALARMVEQALGDNGRRVLHATHHRQVRDHLERDRPDLILYQIDLPHWHGLKFLREIRGTAAEAPVILTGRRLEAKAIGAALRHGAYDFLPKPHTARELAHALHSALAGKRAMRMEMVAATHPNLAACIEVPSRREFIGPLVSEISELAARAGFCDDQLENKIQLALVEGITNAMEHGHGWDPCRTVRLQATAGPDSLQLVVEDCGRGFCWQELPDPTDHEHLLRERGRGVYLMKSVMDTVRFNRRGNVLTLIKFRAD